MKFNSLGKNIQKYRKKLGLTQKELAEKLMKSEISIRKYESGNINIPPSTLFNLCQIFNINLGELLGDDIRLYIENNKKYEKDLLEITFTQTMGIVKEQRNTLSNLESDFHEMIDVGLSWHKQYLNATSTPKGLLSVIIDYLMNNDLYFTTLCIPNKNIPMNSELIYFKNSEIDEIVEKICNLAIEEISRIEDFDLSIYDKTYRLTKKILKDKNVELNKKEFEELFKKLESNEYQ